MGTGGKVGSGGVVGSGGTSTNGGTVGSGGMTSAGGQPGSGGATVATGGVQGSGGTMGRDAGQGGMIGRDGGQGGVMGSGGATVIGGSTGAGGAIGSGGSSGGTCANGATAKPCPPTGNNSIAYIGCSMANNIGTGYREVNGKIMWNDSNYGTGAMVVGNWTSASSSSWTLFDQKATANGGKSAIKAIMVQICIFSPVPDSDVISMIKAARQHVPADAHIYMVGQPQYPNGANCTLANKQEKGTDDQAKKIGADTSIDSNMSYLGVFMLDPAKNEVVSDGCHATDPTGTKALGNQAVAYWGG